MQQSFRWPRAAQLKSSLPGLVTLLSDFGQRDGFDAVLKGVLYSLGASCLRCVDLSHELSAHNIDEAAFILTTVFPYYPPGTVHLLAMDPPLLNQGDFADPIAVQAEGHCFLGFNNGFLRFLKPQQIQQAVRIENESLFLESNASTFRARDQLAPIAAYWATGQVQCLELGTELALRDIRDLGAWSRSDSKEMQATRTIAGSVIHIDVFGNVISNITESDLAQLRTPWHVALSDRHIARWVSHYQLAPDNEVVALWGCSGYLELSLKAGSAAQILGVSLGASVEVCSA